MAHSMPGPSGPSINIKIKTMRPEVPSLSVDLASDALVSSLKERLAPLSRIPVPQQRLIFKGRVLRDEQKLNEAGVEAGNTLHLVERPPDAMQQDGAPPSAAQAGQVPMGAGGMPDLGQFLQGMLASLGAPQPGAAPVAGQAAPAAGAPRPEPIHLLGAVDAYLRQLQEGGGEAVAPILVTSLAPRNIEGLRVLHGSLTAASQRILEGVPLSPELQAMLEDATAHPDRMAAPGAADAGTGASAAGAAAGQPGHRPTIASDPLLQARLAQQSYPYMPLALAALVQLLRRTQQHLADGLSPVLARTVDSLGSINALDASNRQEVEAQLRILAGALHGSAALLTELSRGTAATMHAVGGNTAALAANAASVLDPMAGSQPVFPRLLPRSNMPLDVLLPMGINIPLGVNPLAGAGPQGQAAGQQPGAAGSAASGPQQGAPAGAAMAGVEANQDLGSNVFAALTQQLPGLMGALQQGGTMQAAMPASGAQVTVWPTATIETVHFDVPDTGAGGMGGLAELLSMFGGGAAASGMPMPVDGVPVMQQEQPNSPFAHEVATAVMRSLGPMVTTIANQVVAASRNDARTGAAAPSAAAGAATGAAGAADAAAGGAGAAGMFNSAVSSAIARMATVLSDNADRVQQELQQGSREVAAGTPFGQVFSGVVQRTLTTLAQAAAQPPQAAGTTASGPTAATGATAYAGLAAAAAPTVPAATASGTRAAAAGTSGAAAPAPAPASTGGATASSSAPSQQPRGLGGGLRPTLPAKRKTPPSATAAAGADGAAAASTSTADAGAVAGDMNTPRQRLAPVLTSGEARLSSGGSGPGSPGGSGGDRRKSLTRTPTPGLLRLTESGRSTPRGELHPLREFPDEALNSMAEAAGEHSAPSNAAAQAAPLRQTGIAGSAGSNTLPARPSGMSGAATAPPDLSGLLQMLGGLSAPQQARGAGGAGAPSAAGSAAGPAAVRPSMPLATGAGAGGGAGGAGGDLSGLVQMMGGLLGGAGGGAPGARGAGAGAGNAAGGGMGGLMQMAAQVASDPNMQPMLNNMASSLFGGGAGGGAGGLGSLLSGLLGAPPPGSSQAGPSTLVASMDALDTELSASEAAAWRAMLEADEAAQASIGSQPPLSEAYQAGTPLKSRSLMSVIGGEAGTEAGKGGSAGSAQ